MKIETKYQPGSFVWVMCGNKPCELQVREILVNATKCDDGVGICVEIKYRVSDGYAGFTFDESECCTTKNELKDKIFK